MLAWAPNSVSRVWPRQTCREYRTDHHIRSQAAPRPSLREAGCTVNFDPKKDTGHWIPRAVGAAHMCLVPQN